MTAFTILADTSTPGNFDGTTLPKLQFGDTIVSFAGHHVIPQGNFNFSELFTAFREANLFNPNNFAQPVGRNSRRRIPPSCD